MKEGFYSYKSNIYYGEYDETQVSGRVRVLAVKPERIMTEHPISGNDWAVNLRDNHRISEPEYKNFKALLSRMSTVIGLGAGSNADLTAAEKRLDVPLPRELKAVYAAVPDECACFAGDERFLIPEELYTEDGKIVFCKKKRAPAAGYDIASGCLARYFK